VGIISNNRYAAEANGSIIRNSSFQSALPFCSIPMLSKARFTTLGSMIQKDTSVFINQAKPTPNKKVASLLLAEDL